MNFIAILVGFSVLVILFFVVVETLPDVEYFFSSLLGAFSFAIAPVMPLIFYKFYKWTIEIKKDEENREKIKSIQKYVNILTISIAAILITIISIDGFTESTIFTKDHHDISNWVTLTVEIGVGVIIALIILVYSQFREEKMTSKITHSVEVSNEKLITVYTGESEENYTSSVFDISILEPSILGELPDEDIPKKKEEHESVDENIKSHEIKFLDYSFMNELLYSCLYK